MFAVFAFDLNVSGAAAFVIGCICILTILLVLLLPEMLVAAFIRKQAVRAVERRHDTIIAQYDPPYGFSPAEMGLMYDMQCDMKEIRATLLDLERRQIITIAQDGTVSLVDPAKFDTLPEYEQIAIRMYDKQAQTLGATQTVPLATNTTINGITQPIMIQLSPAKSKQAFTEAVRRSLLQKGYPTRNYWKAFFMRMFIIGFVVGLWPVLLAYLGTSIDGKTYGPWSIQAIGMGLAGAFAIGIVFWPIYLTVGFVAVVTWVKIAGRSWLNTKQSRKIYPELEGYRLFLKAADLSAIQTADQTGDATQPIIASLPYAIVFGLDTKLHMNLRH